MKEEKKENPTNEQTTIEEDQYLSTANATENQISIDDDLGETDELQPSGAEFQNELQPFGAEFQNELEPSGAEFQDELQPSGAEFQDSTVDEEQQEQMMLEPRIIKTDLLPTETEGIESPTETEYEGMESFGQQSEEIEPSERQYEIASPPRIQIPHYPDEEQEKAAYLRSEYLKLLMFIDSQKRIIGDIKNKIYEKCHKCPRLKCDDKEIRELHCCLESENTKLQCLIKKVMEMQNTFPRQWEGIHLITSFDEDTIPFQINDMLAGKCGKMSSDTEMDDDSLDRKEPCVSSLDLNEVKKLINCLSRQVKNPQSTKSSPKFDRPQMQKDPPNPCRKDIKPHGINELARNYNMQEKLVADNSCLERNRFKIQEEILCRDRIIDCFQQKIQLLQSEICKRRRGKVREKKEKIASYSPPPQLKSLKNRSANLENNVSRMQSSFERLKVEMDCLRQERDYWGNQLAYQDYDNELTGRPIGNSERKETRAEKIKNLKHAYQVLLTDYYKKESELKKLKEKMNDDATDTMEIEEESKDDIKDDVEMIEIKLLREKLHDLTEEQEEFKFLLKEQSQQLDEIRSKYLNAQQKVEEQKCLIEKTDMSSKRIEEQVASEIQRITSKFQQKCAGLLKFPKLLEQEQLKLVNCIKEKNEVQQKLNTICKEYNNLKQQYENNADGPDINIDWHTKTTRVEQEVILMKEKIEILKKNKLLFSDNLTKAKDDYDALKKESARILARTKERTEQQQKMLTQHTNKLEKELAQCRAASVINISDRDELIKELQGQIKALTFAFDAAKEQILNLQNKISYLM